MSSRWKPCSGRARSLSNHSDRRNPLGLRIAGLSRSFPMGGDGHVDALRGVEISIEPGEFLVIVGPNGSGKTTLLNVLAGDIAPDAGSVELLGGAGAKDWLRMPRWERATYMARVHQDPRLGTASGMTVWENLRLACCRSSIPAPWRFSPKQRDREWFSSRLERLGLDSKMDSCVSDLSQGQRQLLALELAMLRQPAFLLVDEHTASLDRANAKFCLDATVQLGREAGTTIFMVTHNLMEALTYGDRLVVVREGRIFRCIDACEKAGLRLEDVLEYCGYVA